VQVFRLVTEHTIEEKIVERAQQKLKLDAMVVQSGRLKDKDSKLSRDELLSAVRFGADKIFKSKDSSITDDDIDLIMDAGRQKTQALNEKLTAADKGDMLDFKFDGSSFQTFDGVDYSQEALNRAQIDAGMLGLFDLGKRERKEATYNEASLFKQQVSGDSSRKPLKKKAMKLPKHLRLPRMEEWQMYDREALFAIQAEEEISFRGLPEEKQKLATAPHPEDSAEPKFELPPLISADRQAEKQKLLAEGFSTWKREDFNAFVKSSAKYGRDAVDKIAVDVGKPEPEVLAFSNAFWGDVGRSRMTPHERDKFVKQIEKGAKRLSEMQNLERATALLVYHFDNPWDQLEFTYVNCRDKQFTLEEDRHLLCWCHKVRKLGIHVHLADSDLRCNSTGTGNGPQ
jgi:SWI/SNF-related matrix-associated actin-dependent regulator of chromatin subfamily A member 5